MTTSIAVVGAGAWGTAIAAHLARRAGLSVTLWARDASQARSIAATRFNTRYLPGIELPGSLAVTFDLAAAASAELLVVATPVKALQAAVAALADAGARAPLVWLSKGLLSVPAMAAYPSGVALAHQVIAPLWDSPVGIVSGPSFADEVARGLPTAVAVAATEPALASRVASLLRAETLRALIRKCQLAVAPAETCVFFLGDEFQSGLHIGQVAADVTRVADLFYALDPRVNVARLEKRMQSDRVNPAKLLASVQGFGLNSETLLQTMTPLARAGVRHFAVYNYGLMCFNDLDRMRRSFDSMRKDLERRF